MAEPRKQNLGPEDKIERRKAPRRRDLSRALGKAVLEIEDERAERQKLEERNAVLEAERYTDKKTGIASRLAFDEKFSELVSIAHVNNEPLAFMFFDANKLHDINKKQGHLAGDNFLKKIAQGLKSTTRDTDLVARLGGDEFGIVLTGYEPISGVSERELIEDTIAKFKGVTGEDASFGIAILGPGETAEELYARADTLCTVNKPAGSRSTERLAS